jgi:hypothetical protein
VSRPDRYAWDRNARRVQPLAAAVRVFTHTGRAVTVDTLADLDELVAQVDAADPECATRIAAELEAIAPGITAAARYVRSSTR